MATVTIKPKLGVCVVRPDPQETLQLKALSAHVGRSTWKLYLLQLAVVAVGEKEHAVFVKIEDDGAHILMHGDGRFILQVPKGAECPEWVDGAITLSVTPLDLDGERERAHRKIIRAATETIARDMEELILNGELPSSDKAADRTT